MQSVLTFLTVFILCELKNLTNIRLYADDIWKEKLRLWSINKIARFMLGGARFYYNITMLTIKLPLSSCSDKCFAQSYTYELEQFQNDISKGVENALAKNNEKTNFVLIKTLTKKLYTKGE